MVLSDLLGMSDSDYMYNQSRAHSADMFFMKMRFVFWTVFVGLSSLLIGNIMGVFDINIMGWLINGVKSLFY